MKKFILILILGFTALFTQAQLASNDSLRASRAQWVLTNADTVNYVKQLPTSNPNGVAAMTFTITRLSGTAAGSAAFQYTIDGQTWLTDTTFSLTNAASQTFQRFYTSLPYSAYRVRFITSGTVTARAKGWLLYRRGSAN